MHRPSSALLALCVLLVVHDAHAVLIDSFESGSFSISLSGNGNQTEIQSPNPAHCIASQREVLASYSSGSTGTMTCELVPFNGQDDAIVTTMPDGLGAAIITYQGGPWDLTDGGSMNRITVRATGGSPETFVSVQLFDSEDAWSKGSLVSATGNYQYPFSSYFVDVTAIEMIKIWVTGEVGETVGIRSIETTSGSATTLIYDVWSPTVLYFCNEPGRGASALGWNWGFGGQVMAGPALEVTGVSGQGCQGVAFDGTDSGGGGGQFGEVGLVSVDWQGPTFDNAAFEMRFVTDPSAPYVALLQGDPVVTNYENSFVIGHDVHVSDVFGVPDGVVHQELIVAPHPDQEIYLDWVEAIPIGGGPSEVGYSLSFGYTGAVFDPGSPLLEISTTSTFTDDAGVTGITTGSRELPAVALAAHPSVTRSETRFVLPGSTARPATIDVFDVTGRRVRQLETRNGEATWNGTDAGGVRVPAGVYFGRADGIAGSARVVVLR